MVDVDGIRRRGVVGVGTIFLVVVVEFSILAFSIFRRVDDRAWVSGYRTIDEEHVLLKSSRERDHTILPPYPSLAIHSAFKHTTIFHHLYEHFFHLFYFDNCLLQNFIHVIAIDR